jgi:hypothetical protein
MEILFYTLESIKSAISSAATFCTTLPSYDAMKVAEHVIDNDSFDILIGDFDEENPIGVDIDPYNP